MKINRFSLCKFLIIFVVSFSFSINITFAHQTDVVHSHYGPRPPAGIDNSKMYRPADNGQYRFPYGIDRSTESGFFGVIIDPAFERKTKKDRSITSDLQITPFYDLIVQIRLTWGSFYATDDTLTGLPTEPPDVLPYKAYITVGGEKILGPGTFKKGGKLTDRNYTEFDVYEWKIKGYPDGIVSGEKLTKLTEAIKNGTPEIRVSVEFPDIYDGPQAPEEIDPGFSLPSVSSDNRCSSDEMNSLYNKLPSNISGEIKLPLYLQTLASLYSGDIKKSIADAKLPGKSMKDGLQDAFGAMGTLEPSTLDKVTKFVAESMKNLGRKYNLNDEETTCVFSGMLNGNAKFTIVSFKFVSGPIYTAGFGSKVVYQVKKDSGNQLLPRSVTPSPNPHPSGSPVSMFDGESMTATVFQAIDDFLRSLFGF